MDDRDISCEVNRYVEWLAAKFEIEHGIDPHDHPAAMSRLHEVARVAHAERGKQEIAIASLVDGHGLEEWLTASQLDAIFDGTSPIPDVEPSRLRRRTELGERNDWNWPLVRVVLIAGFIFSALFAALVVHWIEEAHAEKHEHPTDDYRH